MTGYRTDRPFAFESKPRKRPMLESPWALRFALTVIAAAVFAVTVSITNKAIPQAAYDAVNHEGTMQ